jgi:hypothetical protein
MPCFGVVTYDDVDEDDVGQCWHPMTNMFMWKSFFIIEMWICIILVLCLNYFNMQQNPIVFKRHLEMIIRSSIWNYGNHLLKSYLNHNRFIFWPICQLIIVDTKVFIKIMPCCAWISFLIWCFITFSLLSTKSNNKGIDFENSAWTPF